jgi:hypothetical protein
VKRRTLKRFRVRFRDTNWFFIDLKARDEDDAMDRAEALYLDRASNAVPRGFSVDMSEGSLGNFEATPLDTRGDAS